jgi:hypothetical protein
MFATESGVKVTKSHGLVQYHSVLGKSVQIVAAGYMVWCYKVMDLMKDENNRTKKRLIQFKQEEVAKEVKEKITGSKIVDSQNLHHIRSLLGPVRNKGT